MPQTAIPETCFAPAPGFALAATPALDGQAQPAVPEVAAPNSQHAGQSGANAGQSPVQAGKPTITQKLAESNGTIPPGPVDTGLVEAPPPTAGAMPIVKPPSHVQSK